MTNYVLPQGHPFDRWFEAIAQIPHGSRNEKALSDFIVDFAKERKLWWNQDEDYNVIIKKAASVGYETAKPVILQAHIDMVCEKVEGSAHDFMTDPIKLVLDGNILRADGTTLGADDAVGVAYMLAILDDKTAEHPPLECVFTTGEEIGMLGIQKLHFDLLEGRKVINLDNAGETETGLNAAGGENVTLCVPVERESHTGMAWTLRVAGLSGGHSGCGNNVEKGNAILLLAGILCDLCDKEYAPALVDIQGGKMTNAFPTFCEATFFCDAQPERLEKLLTEWKHTLEAMYQYSEPDMEISFSAKEMTAEAMTSVRSEELLNMIFLLPNGVSHKSLEFEDFVSASSNVGVVETADQQVRVKMSIRGETEFRINELHRKAEMIAKLYDVAIDVENCYPCWRYSEKSELREFADRVIQKQLGKHLRCEPVHAGVELCYFAEAFPEIDALGMGPIAGGAHSPDEWLDMDSAHRFHNLLLGILKECRS